MAAKRGSKRRSAGDALFAPKEKARVVPFAFVLDELSSLDPVTRPMFGCTAVYVGEKIVFILRKRGTSPRDDGVWIATTHEHHASLRRELPSMRAIEIFGGDTGWRVLPADGDGFEDEVLHACALVRRGDARVGKVPKGRKRRERG